MLKDEPSNRGRNVRSLYRSVRPPQSRDRTET
uniref:Uncharacterized protein n=1 Tax=Influenza A virus (strain A/Northern Territory/60/1968 H3N2) TaxID=384505 RepID=Q84108_I68A6|nr:unnamed protein product [Influenza A virus (A/nt/60/1968(H3N2))]